MCFIYSLFVHSIINIDIYYITLCNYIFYAQNYAVFKIIFIFMFLHQISRLNLNLCLHFLSLYIYMHIQEYFSQVTYSKCILKLLLQLYFFNYIQNSNFNLLAYSHMCITNILKLSSRFSEIHFFKNTF